jgi:predicted Zn-dependent protease
LRLRRFLKENFGLGFGVFVSFGGRKEERRGEERQGKGKGEMAGRAGIAERRLKPLWDAIDHRQYKPALKLATGLIAKHPDSAYLLALKALVLERLGKDEEAADLCEQAKASGPVDEFTLTTLQLVFQRLHKCMSQYPQIYTLFTCFKTEV